MPAMLAASKDALRISDRITNPVFIRTRRYACLPLPAATKPTGIHPDGCKAGSNLRYKGELDPAAFAAATRKPDRHTLWNLLAHRGERTFKHPQRSSCIHRILKFSCLITEKKLRTQKSPQLFCISSRFLISPTKRSGSVTLINEPKESTRITSSVSSSCR